MLLAAISTDVTAILTAIVAGLVVGGHALAAYDRARRAHKTDGQVEQIHTAVNSRLDEQIAKVDALQREIGELKQELHTLKSAPAIRRRK